MNPRTIAVKILAEVLVEKRSLTSAILTKLPKNSSESSFIKEVCYGTLRWYFRLNYLLSLLLKTPLKQKDNDIQILILIGFYQLLYLRVPEHAAVTETVEAVRLLQKPWATKLINGVLRTFLRNKEDLLKRLDQSEESLYAHPKWLIHSIREAWPEHWMAVLDANNQYPPFSLRVNLQRISREDWLKLAHNAGIKAKAISPETAILMPPQDVNTIPGFMDGQVSVQDSAAQLAASLLELRPGQRVLDACAAPGGKTAHIAEMELQLAEIIAVDNQEERLERAKQNWQRLKLSTPIQWLVADASSPEQWWNNVSFDRILLDAPCSATGVIRRHPDIKVLRKKSDIASLAAQQLKLLETLWALLAPGGILVYATCSILPQENTQIILEFIAQQKDAVIKKIQGDWGIATEAGRQILPANEGMDGFFYSVLEKT